MNTIILFYKYVSIISTNEILKWQKNICKQLGLKGRIIIANEGINGTLGGSTTHIQAYKDAMQAHALFADIDFKESKSKADHFPRLRIIVKKEVVYLGLDPQKIRADQGGIHLEPAQAHSLIAQQPDDLVIVDCRNQVESAIGAFQGALKPHVNTFREFPAYVDKHLDTFKDKQVLMYCTGGIRCERASAYIKSKGISKQVYQIKGGIARYVEQFPAGYFKGKNYVFDGRTALKITDDILGSCYICKQPADEYTNCLRAACNLHFIDCSQCSITYGNTCSSKCYDLITNHNAPKRPAPLKAYNSLSL